MCDRCIASSWPGTMAQIGDSHSGTPAGSANATRAQRQRLRIVADDDQFGPTLFGRGHEGLHLGQHLARTVRP